MEQSPSREPNSHSSSQEIPCFLWNLKVHYHIHKSLLLVPVLSQMHPVHIFLSYFPKIISHIIFQSTPVFSKWSLPFRLYDQIFLISLI
jgi:hypothetical protein